MPIFATVFRLLEIFSILFLQYFVISLDTLFFINIKFIGVFRPNVLKFKNLWPSYNALDSDQHGPEFEAHRRPLVTSGRASGSKCWNRN